MKIAILGNGRMGKRISELAKERGHSIVGVSSSKKPAHTLDVSAADVAVDFSTPSSAFNNISHAIKNGIPVISGTTAWLDQLDEIHKLCEKENGTFLYASNFSLGMNIFFELNKKLSQFMKGRKYKTYIHEIHHKQKLDSPSGTAITLENDIKDISGENTDITSDRMDGIAGTHTIIYSCSEDEIEIKHTAKNRDGFAMGAILAAEWIKEKKGIFTLDDVLRQ
jgi:4-hydroxy-tetrahydrodipicolinate reductase